MSDMNCDNKTRFKMEMTRFYTQRHMSECMYCGQTAVLVLVSGCVNKNGLMTITIKRRGKHTE